MNVTKTSRPEGVLFAVEGHIDSKTSPGVHSAILPALCPGAGRVVVDLRGVTYVSSAGLRVILMLARTALEAGVALYLFGPNNPVREVFQISGFTRIVAIVETEAEAFAGSRPGSPAGQDG